MTPEQLFKAKGSNLVECMLINAAFTHSLISSMIGDRMVQSAETLIAARTSTAIRHLAEIYGIDVEKCLKETQLRMVSIIKDEWNKELEKLFGKAEEQDYSDEKPQSKEPQEDDFIQHLNAKFQQHNKE